MKKLVERAWLWLDKREMCPCSAMSRFLRYLKLDDTDWGVSLQCFASGEICGRLIMWFDPSPDAISIVDDAEVV